MTETNTLLIISNGALFLLLGVLGYLIKRAISGNDSRIEQAIIKSVAIESSIANLQLLIVGDYYPRKEHIAYANEVSEKLDKIRTDMHNLRDSIHAIGNKVGILELLERQRGALDHPLQRPEPLKSPSTPNQSGG